MVIVDANVLISAFDSNHVHHARARPWLDQALAGDEVVGLAWTPLLAFLRIVTNPAAYPNPVDVDVATGQVDRWLSAPGAVIAEPTLRHAGVLRGLLLEAGTAGNLVNDVHLAALSVEHGATIVSFDRDFARFAGVQHRLPGPS